jgi:hypothetical protein
MGDKMKVSAIGYNVYNQNKCQKPLNFTGYYDVILEGARTPIKNLDYAQYLFGNLINEIDKDVLIKKGRFFDGIKQIFKAKGLVECFKTLKFSSDNCFSMKDFAKSVENSEILPIASQHGSIMDIINYGKGLKNFHMGFCSGLKRGSIEFYTDKKGDLFVDQCYGSNFMSTGFYSDAGTKKVEVYSYAGVKPEKTFYNKDGSKPFFKNWFLGGTAVEAIY